MRTVHLICNAHIDPIWQWDWQEGVSATLSTFNSAVKLAEKYDYVFCHNEVTVYKYVEEYAPDLFEQIKELVKKGKWHITGGWYLQPDDNMPCGESFVRQIQTGHKYFYEKFGVKPTTAFNVDAFGHTRGLVQILKKCGQNSLIICRPHIPEVELPAETFMWQGFDGSEIKVCRCDEGYNSPLGDSARVITEREQKRTNEDVTCILWGVGNHGGGPSDKDLKDIQELIKSRSDIKIIHSTPDAYFSELKPAATFDKSLHISMPGCYTSLIEVKQLHKKLENELYLSELMSAVASIKGLMQYPTDKLNSCVEDLLGGEFHDVLPGSCIKAGEQNGLMMLSHGLIDATKIKTKAFFALISNQPVAKSGEYPIVVFNPHPYTYKGVVECEFMLADQNWSTEKVSKITLKDNGKNVTSQTIKEDSNLNLDWRKRIIFEAELPPMSVKRYGAYADFVAPDTKSQTGALVVDNGRKRVEISKTTGLIKSYKVDGKEYIKNGCVLSMFDDNPDPWAMGANQRARLGTNPAPFELSKTPSGVFGGMKSVQIIEDGPVYTGIEAFFEKDNSKARIEYRLYKNSDDIDVNVTLMFNDINKIVKLGIPVPGAEKAVGQAAFGTEELFDNGKENVTQRFTAVKSGEKYLTVCDDSRYGGHYENGVLWLSLVRGVTYCAHPIENRELIPLDRYTRKADQAEHNYSFRISVCGEDELDKKANEFNRKPYAVNVFPLGEQKAENDFTITVQNENVTLVAFKKSENREGYILRLHNNYSKPQTTKITVSKASCNLAFNKYEVKTLLYNGALTELDTLEI